MIDRHQCVGTKVRFLGPEIEDLPILIGDIGLIEHVDSDDAHITYRVEFPSMEWAVWIDNGRMEVVVPDDVEMCGWKPRALKAEAELMELRAALKTLSEG